MAWISSERPIYGREAKKKKERETKQEKTATT